MIGKEKIFKEKNKMDIKESSNKNNTSHDMRNRLQVCLIREEVLGELLNDIRKEIVLLKNNLNAIEKK
jgi:septum formation topological specificity factor MinE